LKSRS